MEKTQRTIPCPLSMAGRTETGKIYHIRRNFGFIRFNSNELLSIFFLKNQLQDKDLAIGSEVEFECVDGGEDRLVAENVRHKTIKNEEEEIEVRSGVVEKFIIDKRFKRRGANIFGFIIQDTVDGDNIEDEDNIYFNIVNVKDKSMKLQRGARVLFNLIEDKYGRSQARYVCVEFIIEMYLPAIDKCIYHFRIYDL